MPRALLITYDGQTHTRQQWSRLLGIPEGTISWRHRMGMEPAMILSKSELRGLTDLSRARKGRPSVRYEERRATRIMLTFKGRTKSVVAWALDLGLDEKTILYRLRCDRPIEHVLFQKRVPHASPSNLKRRSIPFADRTMLTLMGDTMSIREWAEELDIDLKLIADRYARGKTVDECLSKTPLPRGLAGKRKHPVTMRVPSLTEADTMRKAA